MAAITKYWVGTVSREHVRKGVEGGFCQVCHGKQGPLARMKPGDWLIYYSPKETMGGKEACQKFTAIGQVAAGNIYKFQMAPDFVPFRRNVTYLPGVQEQPIQPLLDQLFFTKDRGNKWGSAFRFGMLEIQKSDFDLLHRLMTQGAKHTGKHRLDASSEEAKAVVKESPLLKALKAKKQ
jgi:hypothetical protein